MSDKAKTVHGNNSVEKSTESKSSQKDSHDIRKLIENPLIRHTIIYSAAFALIIHILFSITAPCDFLEGEWSAGDILTYTSTIALGLLAIWQNQKFKEENDTAQARLEKLTTQANELSIISKIIEYETANYEELRKAIQSFEKALDFYPTMVELHQKGDTKIGQQIVLLTEAHRIKLASEELVDVIGDNIRLSDEEKDAIQKPLDAVVDASDKVFQAMQDELSNPENHSFSRALTDFGVVFETYKKAIIEHQTREKIKYEQLVYGNMSLQEIKEMYGYLRR